MNKAVFSRTSLKCKFILSGLSQGIYSYVGVAMNKAISSCLQCNHSLADEGSKSIAAAQSLLSRVAKKYTPMECQVNSQLMSLPEYFVSATRDSRAVACMQVIPECDHQRRAPRHTIANLKPNQNPKSRVASFQAQEVVL